MGYSFILHESMCNTRSKPKIYQSPHVDFSVKLSRKQYGVFLLVFGHLHISKKVKLGVV